MCMIMDNWDKIQHVERQNAENHFKTNIEIPAAAIANHIPLGVGDDEPPLKDISLPGTAPTKELSGFEER